MLQFHCFQKIIFSLLVDLQKNNLLKMATPRISIFFILVSVFVAKQCSGTIHYRSTKQCIRAQYIKAELFGTNMYPAMPPQNMEM